MNGENELHFRRPEPSSWYSPYLWPERGKLPLVFWTSIGWEE